MANYGKGDADLRSVSPLQAAEPDERLHFALGAKKKPHLFRDRAARRPTRKKGPSALEHIAAVCAVAISRLSY